MTVALSSSTRWMYRRETGSSAPARAAKMTSRPSSVTPMARSPSERANDRPGGTSSAPWTARRSLRSLLPCRPAHHAPVASRVAAAPAATSGHGRRRAPAGPPAARAPGSPSRSARANSAQLTKRSAGSFSRARPTAADTAPGTAGRCSCTGLGRSVIRRAITAATDGPVNGGCPTSISYSTAASAYWSLRPSSAFSAPACSGLMYAGVPSESPVCVIRWPPACCTASAMPKSATSACPSCSRMFSGLMSRWTTPWRCAWSRASATSEARRSASGRGSWVSRSSRVRSVSPRTYGMT